MSGGQRTLAELPEGLRAELREPLGPVFTDADALLADVDGPVIAVGDVVTAHLERAGRRPAVAVVDRLTERETVTPEVAAAIADRTPTAEVSNEPATLSAALVEALIAAIDAPGPALVVVDGEEDLATLPAVLLAPPGSVVVYGQPGEGMVRATVDPALRERVRELLARFETDDRLWSLLDAAPGDDD